MSSSQKQIKEEIAKLRYNQKDQKKNSYSGSCLIKNHALTKEDLKRIPAFLISKKKRYTKENVILYIKNKKNLL
jgi:hypothetical protein